MIFLDPATFPFSIMHATCLLKRPRRPDSETAAFSLTELLVVIAVLGMITGALAPAVSSVGRAARLTGDGNRVVAMAELARQQALVGNAVTALVMDKRTGTDGESQWEFSIWRRDKDSGAGEWHQISRREVLKSGIVIDESEIVQTDAVASAVGNLPGDYKWVFLPTGNLLGTRSGLLKLSQRGSQDAYTLSLLHATGRAKVMRN